MKLWAVGMGLFSLVFGTNVALADGAPQGGFDDDSRFATPPPRVAPVAVSDDDEDYRSPPIAVGPERPRSPVRVAVGPVGVTTGKGMGLGVGGALDMGKGSVGGRLAAAWTRGEPGSGSVIGESFSQYSGELVLDLHKRGPVHPLLGVGFGVIRGESATGSGYAGIGLLRGGVEYALGFEETDVRLGAAVTGGLVGPADKELGDLRANALAAAYVAIGL